MKDSNRKEPHLPRACIVIYLLTAVSALLYLLFTRSSAFSDWFNRNISRWGRRLLSLLTVWIPFSLAEWLILSLPVLVAGLIILAAVYITRRIVLPLRELTDDTERFAKGDWDISIRCYTQDEVKSLTDSITKMAESTKFYIQEI